MNPLMRAWSVIGLLFMAAIFATIPISPQVTQRGVEVSVDQAQAITYGRNRRVNRRLLRRGAALTPLAAALSPWAYRRAGYAAPPATTTVTTVLPATTTVATALTSASRSAVVAAKCIAAAATTARPPTIGGSN